MPAYFLTLCYKDRSDITRFYNEVIQGVHPIDYVREMNLESLSSKMYLKRTLVSWAELPKREGGWPNTDPADD